MKNRETKDFVAYEYLSFNVKSEKEPMYIDCYENFGWTLVNNTALVDKEDYYINNSNINDNKQVNLKFKRDRKIKNKARLQLLQRKMEVALKEIDRLEKEPFAKGTIMAIILGLFGTIFLAISVFAITAVKPLYVLCILTGIIGLIGWILPYFVFNKEKGAIEKKNISLIEEQYNIVYDNCEQANKLID